jgi:hypothetical protein
MSQSMWKRMLKSKARSAPRGRRVRPSVEALDGRLLLTVFAQFSVNGQLKITDNNLSDVITLDHSGSNTFVNGSAFPDAQITNGILIQVGSGVGVADKVNIMATVKPVTVDGQFDVDDVNMGKNGSMRGIQAPVTMTDIGTGSLILGHEDFFTMTMDDSADTVAQNVTITTVNGFVSISNLAPTEIRFDTTGLNTLDIKAGSGGNTFNVFDAAHSGDRPFTALNTGNGNDTINVFGTNEDSVLSINGQLGSNTVHLGNAGSVQGIQGSVEMSTSQGGFIFLSVDDSGDTVARNVTTGPSPHDSHNIDIEGLAPGAIEYARNAVNFVQVDAGSGGNTFTINDTFLNGTTSNITRINTGMGADIVFVHRTTGSLEINGQNGPDTVNISTDIFPLGSLQTIQGDVTITNAGNFTKLFVNSATDAFDRTVTMNTSAAGGTFGGEIIGLAPARVFYNPNDVNFINLNGGSGRDTFFVQSTAGPASIQINALGGDDKFIVGNRDNTLDDINNTLQLNGNGGSDTLIINDQGSTSGHFYNVTASSVKRLVGHEATINYAAIDFLQVNPTHIIPPFTFPPAAKNLKFPSSIKAGQAATLTGRLTDADGDKKLTLTVDWGDGTQPTVVKPHQKPFSLKHKFTAAGTYTARAIWTDSTGASNFKELRLSVTPKHAKPGLAHAAKSLSRPRH